MIHRLEANVLIALCDPAHPNHAAAIAFFRAHPVRCGWATCPLVENGFLRIFGSHRYPGGPGSPQAARPFLTGLRACPGHQFWPDDLSLADLSLFPALPSAADVTDLYLLALAVRRGGRFATFDAGLDPTLVAGGPGAYHLIGTP